MGHHDVTNARTCQFFRHLFDRLPVRIRPRTFTIGFNGQNSIIPELLILECSFPLMEKILNGQVLSYLTSESLIYPHQSGFLPGHSTVTQFCFLAHKWQMALERGEHIEATFLDLSKAYDRVSIPGLIFKLSCLGFSRDSF